MAEASEMLIVNQAGQALFKIDDLYQVGDRIGFNADNAPDHYLVYTILAVEGHIGTVSEPELVIKEQDTT